MLQIFAATEAREWLEAEPKRLSDAMPHATIVGASSVHAMTPDGVSDYGGVVIQTAIFDDSGFVPG